MEGKNWQIVQAIASVLVSIGILVFAGLAYNAAWSGKPDLVYVSGNTSFPSERSKTYNVNYLNLGKRTAEVVDCGLSFSDAKIEKADFVTDPPSIKLAHAKVTQTDSQFVVTLDYLNAGQSLILFVRANYEGLSFQDPKISFTSKGVDGTNLMGREPSQTPLWMILLSIILVFVAGLITPWSLRTIISFIARRNNSSKKTKSS